MAPAISINLFAAVSLALFCISFTPIAANAVSLEHAQVARNSHSHAAIAKKKRDGSAKRCRPRPSSSSPPPTSSTPPPSGNLPYTPPSNPSPSDTPSTSPSPSPTSSSSPSPTFTPTFSGSGAVGLGWSNTEETDLCSFQSSNTQTIYNWKHVGYSGIINPSTCNFNYMPMCWNGGDSDCYNTALTYPAGTVIMGANEPDQTSQSNLGVDQALILWFQFMHPLGQMGYQLVSPACTNSPNGFEWTKEFIQKLEQQGGWVNFVATHLYSTDLSYATSFLDQFAAAFSKYPIWVTEFACHDFSGNNQQLDYNGVYQYMTGLSSYMLHKSQITKQFAFSWFTSAELQANGVNPLNAGIGDDGKPTPLGYALLNPS